MVSHTHLSPLSDVWREETIENAQHCKMLSWMSSKKKKKVTSKHHLPRRVEWQLLFPFYYCSSLCLDCFKEWVIRKHKKCAFLHNNIKLGRDLEFPKQNLHFAKKRYDFKKKLPTQKQGAGPDILWYRKWCYVAFHAWPRLPLAGTTRLQSHSITYSAPLETDKYHVNDQNVQASQ